MNNSTSHPIRIGLKLAPRNVNIATLRRGWVIADAGGFDHLWVFDHFGPVDFDPDGPVFEAWTLLGAMAELTSRIRIGALVSGNTYRHPGVLAKMAVTVDHLSGGRLEMGIGAAHAVEEHSGLGLKFDTTSVRIRKLAEACVVLKRLWTEPVADFRGEYYTILGVTALPKPLQKPYPPIWIGGSGERLTLRVVAEHADVWNLYGTPPDEAARLSSVLDEYCRQIGRPPHDVRRSIELRLGDDPQATIDVVRAYISRGFTEIVLVAIGDDVVRAVDLAADKLLPAIRSEFGRI